jgi:hemoglobin
MTKDIQGRSDIELLINSFYDKVKVDAIIGYFFDKVIPVNWEKHLPTMYNFWENVVFNTGGYEGNPLVQHQHIHQKSAMRKEHFDQWLKLFTETVDELFDGDKAGLIKQRAISIATVMQIKILH